MDETLLTNKAGASSYSVASGFAAEYANVTVTNVATREDVLLPTIWSQGSATMMDYMRDVSNAFKRHVSTRGKDVHLVFIGLGTPRLGTQLYDRIIGSGFPNIHLYIDQPRAAYKAVGAAYGIPKFDCGKCCYGTLLALWQGTTRCWCICNAGAVEQQGAEFVMTPSNECKFRHMEKEPGDHAKEVDFFQAAGIDIKPAAQQMK